jgi:hypothetical protein
MLILASGPHIEVSADYFMFHSPCDGNGPEDQTLTIRNGGRGTINWEVFEDCNWLTVEPNSGTSSGEFNNVTLSVMPPGSASRIDDCGRYECDLWVSDPGALNNPRLIWVELYTFPSGHPDCSEWLAVGMPQCWCYPMQCHGDADGQREYGAPVGLNDLDILKRAWATNPGDPEFDPCADFNHDGSLNFLDLNVLKRNYFKPWYDPSLPNQGCLQYGQGSEL